MGDSLRRQLRHCCAGGVAAAIANARSSLSDRRAARSESPRRHASRQGFEGGSWHIEILLREFRAGANVWADSWTDARADGRAYAFADGRADAWTDGRADAEVRPLWHDDYSPVQLRRGELPSHDLQHLRRGRRRPQRLHRRSPFPKGGLVHQGHGLGEWQSLHHHRTLLRPAFARPTTRCDAARAGRRRRRGDRQRGRGRLDHRTTSSHQRRTARPRVCTTILARQGRAPTGRATYAQRRRDVFSSMVHELYQSYDAHVFAALVRTHI